MTAHKLLDGGYAVTYLGWSLARFNPQGLLTAPPSTPSEEATQATEGRMKPVDADGHL